MILFFNRKELEITFSNKRQSEIRSILASNHIDYKIKVVNRNSAGLFNDTRLRTGTFGQNLEMSYEYIFYVYKRDYEKARGILHR